MIIDTNTQFKSRADWKDALRTYDALIVGDYTDFKQIDNDIKYVTESQGITAYFNKRKVGYWNYDNNTGIIYYKNFELGGNTDTSNFKYEIGGI
jgi:hypothetical protein